MATLLKDKYKMKVSTNHDLKKLEKNINVKLAGIVTLRQRP